MKVREEIINGRRRVILIRQAVENKEAVEKAIKGINRVGDLADKNNVLDLATEAKRITNKINAKNVKNYDGIKPNDPTPDDPNKTFIDDVVDFMKDWGIQILIVIVVSVITIIPFNAKLRKIRHGI